jgi:3-dehydroquinate synthase
MTAGPAPCLAVHTTPAGIAVRVDRCDSYPVYLGSGLAAALPAVLASARRQGSGRVHVITGPVVAGHHLPAVQALTASAGFPATVHMLPEGEAAKSAPELAGMWRQLHRSGADRRTLVLALGGGSVCDAATLAAATYMRGLPCALIPTTLIAQADAAIGGKGGADFEDVKNLVGAFYHPAAVVIDTALLATLGGQHLRYGMAEIIKIAVISDRALFRLAESAAVPGAPGGLAAMVRHAVARKLELLAADPFERQTLARPLNFGHCVGHALEAASGFALHHGQAVAAGMAAAAVIGAAVGRCPAGCLERILLLLDRYHLPVTVPAALRADTWRRMAEIRRIRNGNLNLVVPGPIGSCSILPDISETTFLDALAALDRWQARNTPAAGERW